MNKSLRNWYIENYREDKLGQDIRPGVTFKSLLKALRLGYGSMIYDLIGVGDSIIRERLFQHLADLLHVRHEYIWDLWLNI